MINKQFVYDKVLPLIKEKGRKIDYLLIQQLFENKDKEIIEELKKYQNEDLGFGNALEPDVRMPNSSVVASDIAVSILEQVKDIKLKESLIKDLVEYYENIYSEIDGRFYMVPKEVDDYPHAIWWNHKDLDKNFPFGNPDPEVIGFLYQNRKHLKKLSINKLINMVVSFILDENFKNATMHTLLSVLKFHKLVDADVKNLIHDRVHFMIDKELDESYGRWNEYSLEPYKIYNIDIHFVSHRMEELQENLNFNLERVMKLEVLPNWSWHQYNDIFEDTKYDWVGFLYYEIIRALRLHRDL